MTGVQTCALPIWELTTALTALVYRQEADSIKTIDGKFSVDKKKTKSSDKSNPEGLDPYEEMLRQKYLAFSDGLCGCRKIQRIICLKISGFILRQKPNFPKSGALFEGMWFLSFFCNTKSAEFFISVKKRFA